MSPDTQAILLLCGVFAERSDGPRPLTLREYNALAGWLVARGMRPADLLGAGGALGADAPVNAGRVGELLARGPALAIASERWGQLGIWVVGRGDAMYPPRIKRLLGGRAPAFLHGVGQCALLSQGGLAVVGSRDADPGTLEAVAEVARRCAREDVPVVSGGARGVDETAMLAAAAAGGAAVGVLSHDLAGAAVSAKYRAALRDGRLVLVSTVHPGAGFSAGAAMARNRYSYCLAQAVLVARTGTDGGTWSGATECLRAGWVPVFVRPTDEPGTGNAALLARKGAVHPWPSERDVSIRDLLERFAAPPASATQLGLFTLTGAREPERATYAAAVETPAPPAATSESKETASRVGGNGGSHAGPADQMYAVFLRLLDDYLTTPRRVEDISSQLGLELAQVRAWLERAVAEDRVARLSRPVRYQRPPRRA